MTKIFETGTRLKVRFESTRGLLSIEQLWDLPLTSKTQFDLDTVAKAVKRELDQASEESFVQTTSPAATVLTLKLDIIKSVIATKLAEREAAQKKETNRQERARLTELLAAKQDDELKGLSKEEIQTRLDQLKDE